MPKGIGSGACEAKRSHLFISYATEDSELASWLARKLAAQGYAVWFDRMKLLGGEPWVHDIDIAINERTFRLIGLLSQASKNKPNPTKERTCALKVGKRLGIPDFLIPLKVDAAEVDWQMTDLCYLPFHRGWSEGWRQLLAKLESIKAPRHLANGAGLAAATFNFGEDLISAQPERIFTNILPVKSFPETVEYLGLDASVLAATKRRLIEAWAFYTIGSHEAIAFGPPPREFAHVVTETKGSFKHTEPKELEPEAVRNGVLALLERTLRVRLLRAGIKAHPKDRRIYYLPSNFRSDGWLRFTGRQGKTARRKIVGNLTVLRPQKPAEKVHHYFAFAIRRWTLAGQQLAFQIRPTLVFSDLQGELITDKRVGPLRRKLTSNWWNDEWLSRLLAATELIVGIPSIDGDGIVLERSLLGVNSEQSIVEDRFGASTPQGDEEGSATVESVQLDDEPEDHEGNDESAEND